MAKIYADEADSHAAGNKLRKAVLQRLTDAGLQNELQNAPVSSLAEARKKKQNRA